MSDGVLEKENRERKTCIMSFWIVAYKPEDIGIAGVQVGFANGKGPTLGNYWA